MKTTTALWLIVVAIVVAAVAVFAVENAQPVAVRFLGWQALPSLALLVIAAFICGGVIIGAVSLPGRIRLGLRVRALERQLAAVPAPAKPDAVPPAAPAPDSALPAPQDLDALAMLAPPASGPPSLPPPAPPDPGGLHVRDDPSGPRGAHVRNDPPGPRAPADAGKANEPHAPPGPAAGGAGPAAPRPPARP